MALRLYGLSLKLVDYCPVQTNRPYNNLYIFITGEKSVFALFWCLKEKVCCETGSLRVNYCISSAYAREDDQRA